MTALDRLKAEKAALAKRQEDARAKERATQDKILKEERRLARVHQAKLGAIADAAGLASLTLATWQMVCAYLASVGTTDADLRPWVEGMTADTVVEPTPYAKPSSVRHAVAE